MSGSRPDQRNLFEVEDYILFCLGRGGRVAPLLHGLHGVLDEDGVAAMNFNGDHVPVGKDDGCEADETANVHFLQGWRVDGLNVGDQFASGFAGLLGQRSRNEGDGQTERKRQGRRSQTRRNPANGLRTNRKL